VSVWRAGDCKLNALPDPELDAHLSGRLVLVYAGVGALADIG
jgi:hypothetical protein